ncbi:unnamed protein product [Caenorhabditis auriculariae]|uniref:Serpentine Receptor, class H n=1 Tax=Caenorhabditis auriculariae TaxID=2777116 RepID=A0A8S1H4J4_9PELO|nr:unnamed protein product [Caenorhabditis auriculariae]
MLSIFPDLKGEAGGGMRSVCILQCEPYGIHTSGGFILDLTSKSAWFSASLFVGFTPQVIFYSSHGIYKLQKQSSHMSNKTRNLQKYFFYNLCAQASIPMIFVCVPLIFTAVLINSSFSQWMSSFILIMLTSHGGFSSIFTVFSNKFYRNFFLKLFRFHFFRPKKTTIQVSNVLISHGSSRTLQ